jgi:hypothetical protein
MSYSVATARKLISPQTICLVLVAALMVVGLLRSTQAYGAQLPVRSISLSRALPGVNDTYAIAFTLPHAETLGSIELQLCSDSPLVGNPCTAPVGSNLSTATLGSQVGATGFTVLSATANTLVLGRSASTASAGVVSYTLNGVANPSSAGAYFGRLQTFPTANATGTASDYGGLAFAINASLHVSVVVPPYLYFCVGITVTGTDCTTATGNYINLGDFSTAITSVAQTQMVAGTNADTGYDIVASGTTLTSGNDIIPALATPDVSRPGTSQFGMNLVANQDPQVGQSPAGQGAGVPAAGYNLPNSYKFVPGDTVVSVPVPDYPRNYTTSYIANISKSQASGVYVSTLTYVASGAF